MDKKQLDRIKVMEIVFFLLGAIVSYIVFPSFLVWGFNTILDLGLAWVQIFFLGMYIRVTLEFVAFIFMEMYNEKNNRR